MRLRGPLLALLFIGLGMIVSCSRDWDGLVISQCTPGVEAECDGIPETKCETDLRTSENCGRCGKNCTDEGKICSKGTCKPNICVPFTWRDCDDDLTCEVNSDNDVNNCGDCEVQCNSTNGKAACKNGKCSITCSPGFADCDGKPDNGCETPALNCCKNGKKDGDEFGVDCGGSCPPCCGDGKKNANEKEVDCGGGCSKCPTCYNKKKEGIELGIDCGGECWAVGRFCPSHCPGAPLPAPNNWIVSPNPNNLCVVPYNAGGGSCPSQQASTANCVALPLVVGHDPRRDCLTRAIRRRGDYENGITNCTKPSYNQTCMVNLAVSAGVPTSCNP